MAARLIGAIPSRWRLRLLIAAVVAVGLVVAYFAWFRDSSLVAVNDVEVEGVTLNKEAVTAALERAGKEMTTLHLDDEKLAESVSGFPTVASIKADTTLPHKLTVQVTERTPVAVVKIGGDPHAVGADGLILPGIDPKGLPEIEASGDPTGQLDDRGVAQTEILGAAPDSLRESLVSASWSEEEDGVVVELDGAPELRFGDGSDAEDKWKAVAAVLADPDVNVASYVDVSIPERTVSD